MAINERPLPLVSCIMPTFNRRQFVPQSIRYFLSQDYPNRELLIIDDGHQSVADLIPDRTGIRYFHRSNRTTLGAKRNLACEEARGEIIVHWDDDDWIADWRLSYQVASLIESGADLCGLDQVIFYKPEADQAWLYVYPSGGKSWVAGGTLCYTKAFWRVSPFPEINVGEDTRFVWTVRSQKMLALPESRFYVAMIHSRNTSPKHTRDSRYQPYPAQKIRELLGDDLRVYQNGCRGDTTLL